MEDFVLKYIPEISTEYIIEDPKIHEPIDNDEVTELPDNITSKPITTNIKMNNIVNENDTDDDEKEPASNENIERYLEYSRIINVNLIGTHTHNRINRFKFIKASSNIGIPFDIMYEFF
jgi:hypothetical protein